MSWSEIKKAVNSNLNLPLDKKIEQVEEKVGYVGGVIPRGLVEITKSLGNTGSTKSDFVNIEGKGALVYCKHVFKNTYGGSVGSLYIDEGMSTEKVVNFTASATTNELSVNMQQMSSARLVNGTNISSSIVVNQPIFFNKLRFNGSTGNDNGLFIIKYVLFD